ncbi:MAG: alpha/beta hydrolase family protein [Verrucomicrobiae bacterium]|nr:alpha/beta hydrolase family protein [Verrucomicrobiae bacterium]
MKRREFLKAAGAGVALTAFGASQMKTATFARAGGTPKVNPRTFVSGREDGRFVQTAGFLHRQLQTLRPQLEFRADMTRQEFALWQTQVREKLAELMAFPEVPPQPEPKRIWARQRDGYRLERWEAYPEPFCVVPFYLLVPDGVSQRSPAPAVLCFPGSTGSKEALAGEPELGQTTIPNDPKWLDNRMAYHYARRGMIAVAFDSPATNELAGAPGEPAPNRNILSLYAVWMGRSYEAISVFQKAHVLHWLARQPFVDAGRIAVSGHSLGAKPADLLAVLYPQLIRAVVHNDFVCHWQERAVALNLYDPGAHQVVPGLLRWFDYTDLQAALAPRPLLFTEGGRAKHIAKIRRAYELCGASDAMQVFHYEKYSDPKTRTLDEVELPIGITMEQYFEYAYVDPATHRFRPTVAVPWLAKVFGL